MMRKGTENRRIGETNMNRESSRSHSVFTCIMESSSKGAEDGCTKVKFSRLNLVDLAGMCSTHSHCEVSDIRTLKMAVPKIQVSCLHLVGLASMCCTLSQAQSLGHCICSCVSDPQKEQHYGSSCFNLVKLTGAAVT